jgi:hypothetical protein
MGLDTTHNCFHGSYGTFNKFRYELAKQIGINLNDYIEYNGNGNKILDNVDHDLIPLLNHSDCDGELTPDECKRIVNGLNEVLNNLDSHTKNNFYNFEQRIIQFRDGCKKAIKLNENVKFQ